MAIEVVIKCTILGQLPQKEQKLTPGDHRVGEKKFPEFSRLFQSHKLSFP